MSPHHDGILRTLLYYDIWRHPLTGEEVYRFLPAAVRTRAQVEAALRQATATGDVQETDGFFFVRGATAAVVEERRRRTAHARRLWSVARISMHVIRRFPYVRGVFVSGDLSKNSTDRGSDVDFFIITAPERLWIARTSLILFKKIFLLNRKKYFCLNSFVSENRMQLDEENIFLATEIATLQPLYNSTLFFRYMAENAWIRRFFPNFDAHDVHLPRVHERRSLLQRAGEAVLELFPAGRLDRALQTHMERIWARRYPQYDDQTRARIFRTTRTESRAYVGNFQEKILALYAAKLREFGLAHSPPQA
jgi:hypothetical protein